MDEVDDVLRILEEAVQDVAGTIVVPCVVTVEDIVNETGVVVGTDEVWDCDEVVCDAAPLEEAIAGAVDALRPRITSSILYNATAVIAEDPCAATCNEEGEPQILVGDAPSVRLALNLTGTRTHAAFVIEAFGTVADVDIVCDDITPAPETPSP